MEEDKRQEESVDVAKGFVDSNPFLKPVLNPVEKNLNNLSVNSVYQNSSANATLANNFPIDGLTTYVETLSVV